MKMIGAATVVMSICIALVYGSQSWRLWIDVTRDGAMIIAMAMSFVYIWAGYIYVAAVRTD